MSFKMTPMLSSISFLAISSMRIAYWMGDKTAPYLMTLLMLTSSLGPKTVLTLTLFSLLREDARRECENNFINDLKRKFLPDYKDVFDFLLAQIVFKLFTFYCAKFNTFAYIKKSLNGIFSEPHFFCLGTFFFLE